MLIEISTVGAGAEYGDSGDCRRRQGAYPVQLNTSPELSDNELHDFQFIACSGATINNVLSGGENSQVDQFAVGVVNQKDISTLSISGNDIGFVNILDACIVDWSFFGQSCADALSASDYVASGIESRMVSAITDILKASSQNSGPKRFQVYVTGKSFL
jgi:SAGA-associated factor 73